MVLFARILKLIQLSEAILGRLDAIASEQNSQKLSLNKLKGIMMSQPTEKDLDDALERQSVAIQNAADRVSAKLDALNQKIADLTNSQGQAVDLSDEIASIQADVEKLAQIAPEDVSPPPPPDGGGTPNVPDPGPIENT